MYKKRHALIPSCICFGPLFMSRIGGLADGSLGVALCWWGVVTLTFGLYLMFELIAEQQAFIEELRTKRQVSA